MVMARKNFAVTDDDGNVVDGASIEVRREIAGQPLAAVYSDRLGTAPLGNPYTAADGSDAGFHAAGGSYKITASKDSFSKTWRYEGVGLGQESDNAAPLLFITDFGGVGDSVTDDEAAWNATFSYIRSIDKPARIWVPGGNYLVTRSVDITNIMHDVIIDGDPFTVTGSNDFDGSDPTLYGSIFYGINFTGTAPTTGFPFGKITVTEAMTIDASNQSVTGIPPAAIGGFGYNMCGFETMNCPAEFRGRVIGAYGNGVCITTHDPRLEGPSITGWTINAAGTGYTVGTTLFWNGADAFTNCKAIFRVTSVNGTGGVTGLEVVSRGVYLTITAANSTTTVITGAGSGCTFSVTHATADNAIKAPKVHTYLKNCIRGLLPTYDTVENPGGIAGSGVQFGAARDIDLVVYAEEIGGPVFDGFNCQGGKSHTFVKSVSATAIGATQVRGSLRADFGGSGIIYSGRVAGVELRGAKNNGLSYFFNGGVATDGPQGCYFDDLIVDGSLVPAGTIPAFKMMGGSITGLVGSAADNSGRIIIENSRGIALDLHDAINNNLDIVVHEPGSAAGHYVCVKFNSQIDQAGGGCTGNRIRLWSRDTRGLLESNYTDDGTGRHSNNVISTGNLAATTGASINLPAGSYSIDASSTISASADKAVLRDGSGNAYAINFLSAYAETATAGATTTLTVASARNQRFTGTLAQTVSLPVVSTLLATGHEFYFINDSTGVVTVNSSGGNAVVVMAAGTSARVECVLLTGTTAASWDFRYFPALGFGGKKLTFQNTMTFSSTDGASIAFGQGGAVLYTVRGHIGGLTLSAAGSTATFGVAAGSAADSTNIDLMTLASAYTKTTSSWAVGSGNGAMDTSTVANSTWYHVHLIKRVDTGVVDVLFSLSATAPTMPTNYTLFRRIGSMKTDGSAQWVKFSQNGDEFLWDAVIADVSATNPGTSAATRTLTVPTGVKVNALIAVTSNSNGINDGRVAISSLDKSDEGAVAGNAGMYNGISTAEMIVMAFLSVRTNTSAQIRSRNNASGVASSLIITTHGWIDTRGRLT